MSPTSSDGPTHRRYLAVAPSFRGGQAELQEIAGLYKERLQVEGLSVSIEKAAGRRLAAIVAPSAATGQRRVKVFPETRRKRGMRVLKCNPGEDQRGFTLPEVLITIALLGILAAIAIPSWFGIVESRNVDSAANQLASDLRLAHTRSTNQLADWRVVLLPEKADESAGPDYYLVKMTSAGDVDASTAITRTLPDNTKIVGVSALEDDAAVTALYSVLGLAGPTRSLEFSPDGSMRNLTVGVGSNEVRVTVDGSPVRRIDFVDATSRINIV